MQLSVGTFNLWRTGEPWRYAAERNIVRGAVPGSPAVTMRPEGGCWPQRFSLIVAALRQAGLGVIGLQEVSDGSATGEPTVARLADALGMNQLSRPDCQLALLTTHEIESWRIVPLAGTEAAAEAERGYGSERILHATIASPGGRVMPQPFVWTTFSWAQILPRSTSACSEPYPTPMASTPRTTSVWPQR